jgi:SsrA-binding protein
VRGGEAFLVGSQIPPFQQANTPTTYEDTRTRKLLLNKKQIATLYSAAEQEGLTIVPISLYNKHVGSGKAGFIKCEIAIVKGKKKHDKREDLKKKDAKRESERISKSARR